MTESRFLNLYRIFVGIEISNMFRSISPISIIVTFGLQYSNSSGHLLHFCRKSRKSFEILSICYTKGWSEWPISEKWAHLAVPWSSRSRSAARQSSRCCTALRSRKRSTDLAPPPLPSPHFMRARLESPPKSENTKKQICARKTITSTLAFRKSTITE